MVWSVKKEFFLKKTYPGTYILCYMQHLLLKTCTQSSLVADTIWLVNVVISYTTYRREMKKKGRKKKVRNNKELSQRQQEQQQQQQTKSDLTLK